MKVAVLLSGFPRNFKKTFPFFKKYIMDTLNPDIFYYGYKNDPNDNEQEILDLYKPVLYEIKIWNSEIRDHIKELYGTNDFRNKASETHPDKILSQYFNLFKVNELKLEKEINFKYDLVLRCRPDVFFFKEIPDHLILSALEGNIIIPDVWDFGGVTDSFAMSTSDNITLYCNFFNRIREYNHDKGCRFHPETLLQMHINECKLNRIKCSWFYTFHEYDITGELPVGQIIGNANERYEYSKENL